MLLRNIFAVILLIIFTSCAVVDDSIIPYDPPGATTETRELNPHHKRIIGAGEPFVFIYNEFNGARVNDFYHIDADTFAVVISPENNPINNSAWYAFRLWSEHERVITLRLKYEHGKHRYHPKYNYAAGDDWLPIEPQFYRTYEANNYAELDILVSMEGVRIAAQELINVNTKQWWISNWNNHPSVETRILGETHQGRPLHYVEISDAPDQNHLLLIFGRQHPPEVPGSLALKAFTDRILENDSLAVSFRSFATVMMYPLMNPDGVAGGHWRHNGGGVDLNRDWREFNQPETRIVRDHIIDAMSNEDARIYYGIDFHATNRDVFYTVDKSLPSWPEHFADRWLAGIQLRLPDYDLAEEPFGVAPPIVKNWIYNTFESGAVTYEVGDETDRKLIRDVARAAAESMMEEMLRVYNGN